MRLNAVDCEGPGYGQGRKDMPQMPTKALLTTSKVARLFGLTSLTGLTINQSPVICER